ncbi:hypothetical protein INT43_005236 [Umbelopsis isabellina]|uniref:CDP-diacylglycerol--serine O-phosphatidyltransferase n=1 Tax=Mortierella isabellina TaxID=91625 RepID=A0A8H7PH03_MORIS|nr:hypothetical protein INT43_005236 [Umbelopsis isabellina]
MSSRSKAPKSGKSVNSAAKHLSESDAKLISNDVGHFSMVRNFALADVITLMNGMCGTMSIFSSMRYLVSNDRCDLHTAMWFMPFGLLFDFLDGRVARWRNNSSLLGQELDSLADLISFGLAPAALAFAVGMRTRLDAFGLTYFVCCGLARLARFNATVALFPKDATGKVSHFEGLPIPSSLAIVGFLAYSINGLNLSNTDKFPLSILQLPMPMGINAKYGEIHHFTLLFVMHGTAMISRTLRIPKP